MRQASHAAQSRKVLALLAHAGVGWIAALCCIVGVGEAAPAMTVPGAFGVDATGAAIYSIPISPTPGTAGMVPSLSLDYSSNNTINGTVGLGWSLSGLPVIGHCPRTLQTDNIHGSVNFDSNDRFCLNGQRLILYSGTYGADSSTYRTEIESFSKVTAHGVSGNGPQWFEVKTKSGFTMEFGNTTDSRNLAVGKTTVRTWSVNMVSDVKGNYYTVTYTNDSTNGQVYPTRIDYTGNAGAALSPYNSIRFTYTTSRTDVVPKYQAGSLAQITVLLTNIKTYQGANVVYDYRLAYTAGTSTKPTELISVTLCDATTNCFAPTTFGWQGSRDGLTLSTATTSFGLNNPQFLGDFNWDGLTDINIGTCSGGLGNIYLGTSAGTYSTSSMYGTNCIPGGLAADFEGNGISDLFVVNTPQYYAAYRNDGSGGFAAGSTLFAPYYFMTGDYNGDGKTDGFTQSTTSGSHSYAWLSNGDGTFALGATFGPFNHSIMSTSDFDGDGCSDLFLQGTDAEWNPTGVATVLYQCNPAVSSASFASIGEMYSAYYGDFNGDGKTDAIVSTIASGCKMKISTGTGFLTSTIASAICNPPSGVPVVGDFNGDGRSDVALYDGSVEKFYLSTGTGFVASSTTGPSGGYCLQGGDYNSDGAVDLWCFSGSSSVEYLFTYIPELMTSVSNGIGATTTVIYDRINKNSPFYDKGTPGTYPIQTIDGPAYVVKQVATSNGIGGSYTTSYAYTGAFGNAGTYTYASSNNADSAAFFAGQAASRDGLLGFIKIAVSDNQTSLVTTTSYRSDFPFLGQVASRTIVKPGGTPITLRDNENTLQSSMLTGSDGTHYYFVSLQQGARSGTDLDGTSALPSTTSVYTYDSYGNILTATTTIKVGITTSSTETVTNTYTNDSTNWLLGQITNTTDNRVVGTSNLTRTMSFGHDASTGLITQQILEPGTTALKLIADYTIDTFGHVTTTALSGVDITSRSSSAGFDTKGQFQTLTTNALSQQTTLAFDTKFGIVKTVTDPNTISQSQVFDTLGRVTSQTRTDGTKLLVSYSFCFGVNGGTASCPTNGAYLTTAQSYASNGTTPAGPVTNTYYDALGREIASDQQGFDGSNIRVATQYDAYERVSQISRPFFVATGTPAWTAYQYDALGRITRTTFPDTSYSTFSYQGLITSTTNALSQTTTTELNLQGLVRKITDALNHNTTYTYDAFDNLATVTDSLNNVLSNTYDIRGRKTSSSDRDMGSWTYSYDVLSELTTQTDAKSQNTNLSYDLLSRPTERKEVASAGFVYANWIYDVGTKAIGKLSTACTSAASNPTCSSPSYKRALTYDSKGRPSTTTLTIGGTNYVYALTYNTTNGQTATTTYPSGFVALNSYNSLGYLSSIKQNGTSNIYWTLNALDAEMHATSQTAGNGVTTTTGFDANTGMVSSISAGTSSTAAQWSYIWDAIGNLTKRTDGNQSTSEFFCYDSLNRLTNYAISTTATSCTSSGTKTVAYNDIGNITSKSDSGGTYSYPASGASSVRPHAVSSIAGTVYGISNPKFDYDANGNMTCIHAGVSCISPYRTTAWTSFNMVDTVTQGLTTVAFTYDDMHSRIVQSATISGSATTTTYLNDPMSGASSIKTVSGATATWRDYITAAGRIIAERDTVSGTTTLQYFVLDHLSSVGAITDGSGSLVQRRSYDAWGKRRNPDGTDNTTCSITSSTARGFTNQEEIDRLCSVNLNARLYDPVIARFASADFTVPNPADSQAFNRYSYVYNRPLVLIDPSGLSGTGDSNSLSACRYGMSSCKTAWIDPVDYNKFLEASLERACPPGSYCSYNTKTGQAWQSSSLQALGEFLENNASTRGVHYSYVGAGWTQVTVIEMNGASSTSRDFHLLGETGGGIATRSMDPAAFNVEARTLGVNERWHDLPWPKPRDAASIQAHLQSDPEFYSQLTTTETRLFAATANGQEFAGIRVYISSTGTLSYEIAPLIPLGGNSNGGDFPPLSTNLGSLFTFWHPHPVATNYPSPNDLHQSAVYGVTGYLWSNGPNGSPQTVWFRGTCRKEGC